MIDTEHTEFPRAGYRARRWTRFERELYEWMNRPEGQFECWLAKRAIERDRLPAAAAKRKGEGDRLPVAAAASAAPTLEGE